jgi:hypothetical protein
VTILLAFYFLLFTFLRATVGGTETNGAISRLRGLDFKMPSRVEKWLVLAEISRAPKLFDFKMKNGPFHGEVAFNR